MNGVSIEALPAQEMLPAVIRPGAKAGELSEWAAANVSYVDGLLLEFGALLFRGWQVLTPEQFDGFNRATTKQPWEGPAAILNVRKNVYGTAFTSTEGPGTIRIRQHSEFSHNPFKSWPARITFQCIQATQVDGETPLTRTRKVFQNIDPAIAEAFLHKGVLYTRLLHTSATPWTQAFQTTDPRAVEEKCRKHGIAYEWLDGQENLRIRWRQFAAAKHPQTGDRVWFNFAHMTAQSTLQLSLRRYAQVNEQPSVDACFGDGSPIDPGMLTEINEAYDCDTIKFRWEPGDVLLLDNMAVAHGRSRFAGQRRVLVGMSDPIQASDIETY